MVVEVELEVEVLRLVVEVLVLVEDDVEVLVVVWTGSASITSVSLSYSSYIYSSPHNAKRALPRCEATPVDAGLIYSVLGYSNLAIGFNLGGFEPLCSHNGHSRHPPK